MTTIILGGGLAGLSLAYHLKDRCVIIEKEPDLGGLCRSFEFMGVATDIGPHIMFSKNKEVLEHMRKMTPVRKFKRSNKILYKGRLVKYPFENDLASLPKKDKEYCLNEFLNNPYADYTPVNMQQFFLKTFGEGITKCYLQPYNEKIWKFDSSCMDLQMVGRIPKPPAEDIIKSAKGIPTEGYKHQLYFYYPRKGGTQSLINSYEKKLRASGRCEILTDCDIKWINKYDKDKWIVQTDYLLVRGDRLISCIPMHELNRYIQLPIDKLKALKYNSIMIMSLAVKKDSLGDNFAMYVPDKNVIFHRLSKLNFINPHTKHDILMAEVTFRPESKPSMLDIETQIINDLVRLKIIAKKDILATNIRRHDYAYVIYDLDHRKNVDTILSYLKSEGVRCCGRFAEFEYLNMDAVIEHSKKLAEELNGKN